jgi:hypothetical protein
MSKRLFRGKRTEKQSPSCGAPSYPTLEGFNRRCREILGPLVVAGMLGAGLVACDADRTVEETTDGSTQAADVLLPDQGADIRPDLPPMLGAPRMPDAGID